MAAARDDAVYRCADGIVIIAPEKSKGQKAIVDACPIGVVYWNEELQIPQKCTMCAHLLDEGYEKPHCVEDCPNEALYFGDLDDPNSEVSRVIAAGKATPLEGLQGVETHVHYLNIPTVFLAGGVYLRGDETGDEPACGARVTAVCRETGEVRETRTNYFGDWEFEWIIPNAHYDIFVRFEGYPSVQLSAYTDQDHYVAEPC